MTELQLDRLSIVEMDGLFWAADWVSGPFGNTTIDRFHLSFRSRRDADSFVRAAKRALRKGPVA